MKKIIPIVAILLFLFSSCKKEEQFESALILDLGDPALDGCGWVVELEGTNYKPLALNEEFQHDSLMVMIKYEIKSTMANCGLVPNALNQMDIKEINKQ